METHRAQDGAIVCRTGMAGAAVLTTAGRLSAVRRGLAVPRFLRMSKALRRAAAGRVVRRPWVPVSVLTAVFVWNEYKSCIRIVLN